MSQVIENYTTNAGPHSQFNTVLTQNYMQPPPAPDFTAELDKLNAMASPSAAWDAEERRDTAVCHPATRVSPLCALTTWLNSPATDPVDPVRVLSARIGTGKSTLSQTLARQAARASPSQLGASFFFSRSSLDRRSLKGFIPTIAQQLIAAIPQLQPLICSILHADRGLFSKNAEGQWCRLVVEPLAQVQDMLPGPVLILIDGIDECTLESDQIFVLQFILGNVHKFGPRIKLLLTFRKMPALERAVASLSIPEHCHIHLGESHEDDVDIRSYLQDSFTALALGDTPWPSPVAINQLVQRSQRQFIYAAMVLAFVSAPASNPITQLQSVLDYKARPTQTLDRLYLMMLLQIEAQLPYDHLQGLWQILLHLCLSPASPTQLATNCKLDDVKVGLILKKLSPLIDRQPNSISFCHASFIHFMFHPSFSHPYSASLPYFSVFAPFAAMVTRLVPQLESEHAYSQNLEFPIGVFIALNFGAFMEHVPTGNYVSKIIWGPEYLRTAWLHLRNLYFKHPILISIGIVCLMIIFCQEMIQFNVAHTISFMWSMSLFSFCLCFFPPLQLVLLGVVTAIARQTLQLGKISAPFWVYMLAFILVLIFSPESSFRYICSLVFFLSITFLLYTGPFVLSVFLVSLMAFVHLLYFFFVTFFHMSLAFSMVQKFLCILIFLVVEAVITYLTLKRYIPPTSCDIAVELGTMMLSVHFLKLKPNLQNFLSFHQVSYSYFAVSIAVTFFGAWSFIFFSPLYYTTPWSFIDVSIAESFIDNLHQIMDGVGLFYFTGISILCGYQLVAAENISYQAMQRTLVCHLLEVAILITAIIIASNSQIEEQPISLRHPFSFVFYMWASIFSVVWVLFDCPNKLYQFLPSSTALPHGVRLQYTWAGRALLLFFIFIIVLIAVLFI